MNIIKTRKLNSTGIVTHLALVLVVAGVIGAIGVWTLTRSHAFTTVSPAPYGKLIVQNVGDGARADITIGKGVTKTTYDYPNYVVPVSGYKAAFQLCGTPKAKYPTTSIFNENADKIYPNAASTSVTTLVSTSVVKKCSAGRYNLSSKYNLCAPNTSGDMIKVSYYDTYDGYVRTGYVTLCSLRNTTTTNLGS